MLSPHENDLIFSKISDMAIYAIDNNVGNKKSFCERRVKKITNEVAKSLQNEIEEKIKSLNETIQKRKKELDQNITSTKANNNNTSFEFSFNFDGALGKLDFSFGDFSNLALNIVYDIGIWFIPIVGPYLAIIKGIYDLVCGGRDKKGEAKEEMRKNLNKAKSKNRTLFNSQIENMKQHLDNSCKRIITVVNMDKENLEKLRNYIQSINQTIKLEYSKLNITEYGTL